jgi:hypothetical protein
MKNILRKLGLGWIHCLPVLRECISPVPLFKTWLSIHHFHQPIATKEIGEPCSTQKVTSRNLIQLISAFPRREYKAFSMYQWRHKSIDAHSISWYLDLELICAQMPGNGNPLGSFLYHSYELLFCSMVVKEVWISVHNRKWKTLRLCHLYILKPLIVSVL